MVDIIEYKHQCAPMPYAYAGHDPMYSKKLIKIERKISLYFIAYRNT